MREELLTLIPEGPPAAFVPGYAQLGDFSFPGIPALRIEIEPLTAGMRFWAFVSVVHNETQHLTIVTPQ